MDKSIKKCFVSAADEIIKCGEETITNSTGFDPDLKKIAKGKIIGKISNVEEVLEELSNIKYSIECEDSSLTLAADVIANSIYHHFKSCENDVKFSNLHTKEAMYNHPLVNIIYGFWDSEDINYYSDAIFIHPENYKEILDKKTVDNTSAEQ